jgi:hypothetical protein
VSARMGLTTIPDSSWTEFVPLGASGTVVGGVSRYFQYRVGLATSDDGVTPTFQDFTIRYSSDADTIAPHVVDRSPAPDATGVSLNVPIRATFNELLDSASVNAMSVHLRVVGTPSDVPASVSLAGGTILVQPAVALAGNTQYEVTVASSVRDTTGNVLGTAVTWTFTTGVGQWQQTSQADFAAGTHAGTATGAAGGVTLAGAFADDFSGSALAAGWNVHSWSSEGGGPTVTTVSGGSLQLAGAMLRSADSFANQPLTVRAQFGATAYQHLGLATDLTSVAGNYWAMFSTGGTTNTLFARVNVSGATQDVNLGSLPAGFHDYRIVPTASAFEFYVDGVLRATIAATFPPVTPVRVAMSSFQGPAAGLLQVDSARIDSFAATGEFLSSVFDASRTATWGTASWIANLPAGTTLIVEARSGNTATPDGSWSSWSAVTNGGTIASPTGRYLQYRVRLTTTVPDATPELSEILISWF